MSAPQMVINAEALRTALRQLQTGNLHSAQQLFHSVLAADEDNLHANFFLGVIAHQLGNRVEAVDYFETVLSIDPRQARAHFGLGNVLREEGRWEQAAASFREAAQLRPDDARAYVSLGDALRELGRLEEASASYQTALALQPEAARIHNDLGIVLQSLGRLTEAIASFQQALDIDPAYTQAHNNLGNVLRDDGRLDEAIAAYLKALAIEPQFVEALSNLGITLKDKGHLEEARSCLERAVVLKPDYHQAYNNLGIVLNELREPDKAAFCFSKAVALAPGYAHAYNNLGNVLSGIGRLDEAVDNLKKAIAIDAQYAEAYNNLGLTRVKQCFWDEAIENFTRAITLEPQYCAAQNNLGIAYKQVGRLHDSISCFKRAIELQPSYVDAHWNLSLSQLQTGQFREGWKNYESRWDWEGFSTPKQNFHQPLWDGSSLVGKTILLHCEQGFGDSIQFVRYVKNVAEAGGRIIVQCQPNLYSLFSAIPEVDELVEWGDEIPHFDTHAPFMSLPRILDTTLETIPAYVPYLHSNGRYTERITDAPKVFKLGVVWSGNPRQENDSNRSAGLEQFMRFASVPGVALYSLQVGERRRDLERAESTGDIVDLGKTFRDFSDTAAAIAGLDLVIGVDTAVTHLAGAMGKPVWVLLAFSADWRWLSDRDDSPWYPTMRLYRQKRIGDWEGVFEEVMDALRTMPPRPSQDPT